jgi:hypothetical protein
VKHILLDAGDDCISIQICLLPTSFILFLLSFSQSFSPSLPLSPTGMYVYTQVDSASAMLSAGRNLMNSVVQVVKTCYLASSAIARVEGTVPEEVVQWRLQSPQLKQLTPEQSGAPPGNNRDTPSNTYREQRRAEPSPKSQLAEFRLEPEVGGTGRRRKVTPVPPPTRGGRPRRPRGGGGGTDLEAIPEVASSHSLQETPFL